MTSCSCAMYSQDLLTPAGKYEDRCTKEELHRRINLVLDRQREIGEITQSYNGEISQVLTEKHVDGNTVGINERGRFVDISGIHPLGEILKVKISSISGRLKGEIIP
ncbi:MAG: hypothetical protein R2883_07345 [Caldisericia bacterium]